MSVPQCYAYFKTVDKYVKAGKHIVLEFTHDFERSWNTEEVKVLVIMEVLTVAVST